MAERHRGRRTGGQARGRTREDRGLADRAQDEVRSWLGDEEAARRRHRDAMGRQGTPAGRGAQAPLGLATGVPPRDRARRRGATGGRHEGAGRSGSHWRDDDVARSGASGPRDPNYGYRPAAGFDEHADPQADPGWDARSMSGYGVGWRGGRPGPYSGRGPKGYQRADSRILEDVCDRLADAPDVDAGDIEVEVRGGEVTMSGTVKDRWQKRRAEDVVEYVSGVREVHNRLRVARSDGI
jgi:osmotically-inducible protein OsmY